MYRESSTAKPKVLTLDKTWTPHSWISKNEAITYEAKGMVLQNLGDDFIQYRGGENSLTHKQSELITTSIIVVDGLAIGRRHVPPSLTNVALFQRDRHLCAYCVQVFQYNELTRDHVHPTSKGGRDNWMNVVTACKSCNNLKDDMMPGEMLPKGFYSAQGTRYMELAYVPYVPCPAESMIMRNASIRADQMQFLLERISNKEQSRLYKEFALH